MISTDHSKLEQNLMPGGRYFCGKKIKIKKFKNFPIKIKIPCVYITDTKKGIKKTI